MTDSPETEQEATDNTDQTSTQKRPQTWVMLALLFGMMLAQTLFAPRKGST